MQLSRQIPRSLLLVDANHGFCAVFTGLIRRLKPAPSVWAMGDGQSAVDYLIGAGTTHAPPELILVDRALPGEVGPYDVLRAARTLRHLEAVPIIVIGYSDEPAHVLEATDSGAAAYLVKPPAQNQYPQLVRQVLGWWQKKSWPELGRGPEQNALALPSVGLQSPAMAAHALTSPDFLQSADDRPFADRFFDALGWMTRKAEEAIDPFQAALSRACRAHKLTLVQLMSAGGSQSLVRCRREALVDLMAEGWPDETLLTVVAVNERDMRRLRVAARAKVGRKLAGVGV